MDSDYSIHVRVDVSLSSDYIIHVRVYVYCFLWIVTIFARLSLKYTCKGMCFCFLDTDYSIHVRVYVSLYTG